MAKVNIKKVDSLNDAESKLLFPMVEEAFKLTMTDCPEDVKDFSLPTRDALIQGVKEGSDLWKIYFNDKLVGGAMIALKGNNTASLELFFIAGKVEGKGIGVSAWQAIEQAYPDIKTWITMTPYFQKRNIHFYVNKCGFHIVEFHNKWNPIIDNDKKIDDEMFVFKKEIK